jgi:hypothetical protein
LEWHQVLDTLLENSGEIIESVEELSAEQPLASFNPRPKDGGDSLDLQARLLLDLTGDSAAILW